MVNVSKGRDHGGAGMQPDFDTGGVKLASRASATVTESAETQLMDSEPDFCAGSCPVAAASPQTDDTRGWRKVGAISVNVKPLGRAVET